MKLGIECFEVESNNRILRGMLHKGIIEVPVILVHGFFSSNKIGPYRLYFSIAECLNKIGYTVFRVDFSAMGESDGWSDEVTFSDHVLDLKNIIDSILQLTKSSTIHIIAHCMGCCTSLKYAHNNAGKVETLTLLSPFIPKSNNLQRLLGVNYQDYVESNNVLLHRCMYFDRSFIDASWVLLENNIMKNLEKEKILVVLPEQDELSTISDGMGWVNSYLLEYCLIKEADHNFLNIKGRSELLELLYAYYLNYRGEKE